MLKTIDVSCPECDSFYIAMVEVPYGASLPDNLTCDVCGGSARRLLSCQIAKLEIQERTHGGTLLPNGKIATRMTGHKASAEQMRLKKAARQAKRNGDADVAREVNKEMQSKLSENKPT